MLCLYCFPLLSLKAGFFWPIVAGFISIVNPKEMKTNKKLFAAIAAAVLGIGPNIVASGTQSGVTIVNDTKATTPKEVHKSPVSQRNVVGAGNVNDNKHNRPGFLDQKSKRKKLRNNPHFGRSKKCTTKRK
jgi:hypothetical protein